MPAKSVDVAYIAGFFDGEGYVSLRRSNKTKAKRPSYRIIVGFTQRDRNILEWVSSQFGGAIYKKTHKNPRASAAYELIFTNRQEVFTVLDEMEPYIRVKSAQVKLAKEFLQLSPIRRRVSEIRGKTWPLFESIPEDVQIREDYKIKMTALNQRGLCLLSA